MVARVLGIMQVAKIQRTGTCVDSGGARAVVDMAIGDDYGFRG